MKTCFIFFFPSSPLFLLFSSPPEQQTQNPSMARSLSSTGHHNRVFREREKKKRMKRLRMKEKLQRTNQSPLKELGVLVPVCQRDIFNFQFSSSRRKYVCLFIKVCLLIRKLVVCLPLFSNSFITKQVIFRF